MGQIAFVVLLLAVGWLAWRGRRLPDRRPARPRSSPPPPRPMELQKDPQTGVYRPVEREDR